jgi:hypothetical protein
MQLMSPRRVATPKIPIMAVQTLCKTQQKSTLYSILYKIVSSFASEIFPVDSGGSQKHAK